MNKFYAALASVAATAALLAIPAAPVFAAGQDGDTLMAQLSTLDQRIAQAQDSGVLSKQSAAKYGQQIDQLEKLHARYSLDGFSKMESRDLGQKIGVLKAEVARDSNGRV